MPDKMLVGVCGIYCGACLLYRAYKDRDVALTEYLTKRGVPEEGVKCEGCTSATVSPTCAHCDIRDCAKQKGIVFCYECKELPCSKLTEFSQERAKKDNLPHLSLCIGNLNALKQTSYEEWLRTQEERWSCKSCGRKLHWYTENCPKCGATFHNAVKEVEKLEKPQK